MKPLIIFETKGKGKGSNDVLIDRVTEYLLPLLKKEGYNYEIHYMEEVGSSMVLRITKGSKSLLIIPWIRPYLPGKPTAQTLTDYPRLNIRKDLKNENDTIKITEMYNVLHKYNIHFLVMLQKPNNAHLFWFDSYTNIPLEYWKTTYREKGKPLDRIHFPNYTNYKFIRFLQFKIQLNKNMV